MFCTFALLLPITNSVKYNYFTSVLSPTQRTCCSYLLFAWPGRHAIYTTIWAGKHTAQTVAVYLNYLCKNYNHNQLQTKDITLLLILSMGIPRRKPVTLTQILVTLWRRRSSNSSRSSPANTAAVTRI